MYDFIAVNILSHRSRGSVYDVITGFKSMLLFILYRLMSRISARICCMIAGHAIRTV